MTTTHALPPFGTITPWGKPDEANEIAPGIWRISTSRHGGYWLSPDRLRAMPVLLRMCSLTGDAWFEEDSAAEAVVLAFPQEAIDLWSRQSALVALNDALPDDHKLCVLKSAAGYIIGRRCPAGQPHARHSVETWRTRRAANNALTTGRWTLLP